MYHRAVIFLLSTLLFITGVAASVESTAATSWSTHEKQLTTYDNFDGFPAITETNNREIWIVWARAGVLGYRTLYYTMSPDKGKTWSPEMNLTEVGYEYENTKPSITQTNDGNIWVVWASNRPPPPPPPGPDFNITASPASLTITQNSSDTSTITITSLRGFNDTVSLVVFGEPENVTATPNPPQVTPPPNGTANSTLTVTVGQFAPLGNYTLTVIGKSKKTHSVNIDLEITETQSLASKSIIHSSATSETIWDWEIYCRNSSDNGVTWSAITQLTVNSVDDTSPSITQAANGTIYVVWQSTDSTMNQELFYMTSSNGGSAWSAPQQLTDDPLPDQGPCITQTRDGGLWVAWSSYRLTDTAELFYKKHNGTSWSNAIRVTDNADDDSSPTIFETHDQVIWIFWTSVQGPTTNPIVNIYYKYSINNGTDWTAGTPFTTHGDDMWPSATQTSGTKMWVTWTSNRTDNYDIFYRTSLVGDITGPDPPDFPPDGIVDVYDLAFMDKAYGMKEGNPEWNDHKIADITGPENPQDSSHYPPDGIVDIYDLVRMGTNYNQT